MESISYSRQEEGLRHLKHGRLHLRYQSHVQYGIYWAVDVRVAIG